MSNDLNRVFSVFDDAENQVIIKVTAEDALTVAMYPFLSADYAYITITKGGNHIFTVIRKDGTTWNFHWGSHGHTLIGESTEMLRKKTLEFLSGQGIRIE